MGSGSLNTSRSLAWPACLRCVRSFVCSFSSIWHEKCLTNDNALVHIFFYDRIDFFAFLVLVCICLDIRFRYVFASNQTKTGDNNNNGKNELLLPRALNRIDLPSIGLARAFLTFTLFAFDKKANEIGKYNLDVVCVCVDRVRPAPLCAKVDQLTGKLRIQQKSLKWMDVCIDFRFPFQIKWNREFE